MSDHVVAAYDYGFEGCFLAVKNAECVGECHVFAGVRFDALAFDEVDGFLPAPEFHRVGGYGAFAGVGHGAVDFKRFVNVGHSGCNDVRCGQVLLHIAAYADVVESVECQGGCFWLDTENHGLAFIVGQRHYDLVPLVGRAGFRHHVALHRHESPAVAVVNL